MDLDFDWRGTGVEAEIMSKMIDVLLSLSNAKVALSIIALPNQCKNQARRHASFDL